MKNSLTLFEMQIKEAISNVFEHAQFKKLSWSVQVFSDIFSLRLEAIEGKEKVIDISSIVVSKDLRRNGLFTKLVNELMKICDVIVFSGVISNASLQAVQKLGGKKISASDDTRKYLYHDDSTIDKTWEYYEENYGSYYIKQS